jgi:protein-S-isoprenylcysteine O-methyltransferase Ste14
MSVCVSAAVLNAAVFVGWGVITGAPVVAMTCLVVMIAVWTLLEGSLEARHGGASRRAGGQGGLREYGYGIALLVTLIWCGCGWCSFSGAGGGVMLPWFLAVAGLAVAGLGLFLRGASIVRLGDYFFDGVHVTPGQGLVSSGVFGVIRHPAELGTLLVVTGACVMTANGVAAVFAIVVLWPVVLDRVRREDRVLRSAYGGAFDRVVEKVPALVPWGQ